MLLIGLDAASDLTRFGYAIGHYTKHQIQIKRAGLVREEDQENALLAVIAPLIRKASHALIAIDAPLGWPNQLATELSKHQAGKPFVAEKDALFQRETDRFVHERLRKKPLEVGADRIARAAYSTLAALNEIRRASSKKIPLAWNSKFEGVAVIEVYPAGTLKARGLQHSGYKKPEQLDVRRDIANHVAGELEGLEKFVEGSADVFDACLCLAAAKDFLEGLAIPPEDKRVAKLEGWIWVRNSTT